MATRREDLKRMMRQVEEPATKWRASLKAKRAEARFALKERRENAAGLAADCPWRLTGFAPIEDNLDKAQIVLARIKTRHAEQDVQKIINAHYKEAK